MLFQVVAGCLIGLAMGGVLIYGLVELSDWIVGFTHEFSSTR